MPTTSDKFKSHLRSGFGWEPEFPDHRDFRLSQMPKLRPATDPGPPSFSLRDYCSPVRNQLNIGSCVGFSTCAAVELLRRRDADEHSTIYSPLFAYYYARIEDGLEWKNIDAGAYIRDSMKVAARIGVCPESRYLYKPQRFKEQPPPSAVKEARRWKTGAYYACNSTSEIMRAIASGFPVVGGFSCFANMFTEEVDRTGHVPMPEGGFEGGHAVCFISYDTEARRFGFKNSWSEEWGDAGFGTLPFDFINDGLADDFWCLTQESPDTRQDRDLAA